MIFSRAPFRITLAGGGTDLPAFYKKHGSTFLSCAIDKYIYVGFKERLFEKSVRVQYLDCEEVDKVSDLKHNRARACLESFGYSDAVEVNSSADLSGRSGMGSSGSYIVALLAALRAHRGLSIDPEIIASEACRIELDVLKEPVGKQDQYIAAYGNLTKFSIDTSGKVSSKKIDLDEDLMKKIQKNCMIFYTGVLRNASDVLKKQQERITDNDSSMLAIQQIGHESIESICNGDLDKFGKLMHEHWIHKKSLSDNVSLNIFEKIYSEAIQSGAALGGKIIGAGGGGFLMLYVNKDHEIVKDKMNSLNLPQMNWSISSSGVSVSSWQSRIL